jgi:3,2-trans-enoyl-CoA isomerase
MSFVLVSDDSDVRILTMSHGRANVLNLAMVDEFLTAIREAESNSRVRAVVIASAQPGFFSTGFDVEEVFAYDLNAMRLFFGRFLELFDAILRLPKPVVGAIGGHTFAGGAFLALAFDLRVFAEGDFNFALNEINFGAVLPAGIRRALIAIVGPREATRIILSGDTVNPAKALAVGLADSLVPPDELLPSAIRAAHRYAEKPPTAFAFSKRALQRDVGIQEQQESLDGFLDQWFSPECTQRRIALTAAIKSKSAKK